MEEAGVPHSLGMWWLGHLCSYPALLVKSPWSLWGVNKSQVSRRVRKCFYGIDEERGSAWSEHPGERLKTSAFPEANQLEASRGRSASQNWR